MEQIDELIEKYSEMLQSKMDTYERTDNITHYKKAAVYSSIVGDLTVLKEELATLINN